MIICPDALLPEGPDRWTRATVAEAWAQCRRDLRAALEDPAVEAVAIMIGIPGAGKSTWAQAHDREGLVIFDACWSHRGRRAAVARQIRSASKRAIAVWIRTPLDLCRDRNDGRPPWRRVPDAALSRAYLALRECPPVMAEGWSRVLVQDVSHPAVAASPRSSSLHEV